MILTLVSSRPLLLSNALMVTRGSFSRKLAVLPSNCFWQVTSSKPSSILFSCKPNEDRFYGPDSFGDIIGHSETHTYILGNFDPMERIVLTANGNLQRILR